MTCVRVAAEESNFIGNFAFTDAAAQMLYTWINSLTIVGGDVDGDRLTDIWIDLQGNVTLTASDLVP